MKILRQLLGSLYGMDLGCRWRGVGVLRDEWRGSNVSEAGINAETAGLSGVCVCLFVWEGQFVPCMYECLCVSVCMLFLLFLLLLINLSQNICVLR